MKSRAKVNRKKLGDFTKKPGNVITKIIESPEKYIRENLGVNKPNSG